MYQCRILADSISPAGHRLTSFLATFPRIILAEVNTHCMLSRNSASSRAVPVAKRLAALKDDPFVPAVFGRNQKGMQPGDPLEGLAAEKAGELWRTVAGDAAYYAERLDALGVHKQYANRLIEPYSWHTAVLTATDWSNFFNLRDNTDAQGEFQELARLMREAYVMSNPRLIKEGQWHLPFCPEFQGDARWRDGQVANRSALW